MRRVRLHGAAPEARCIVTILRDYAVILVLFPLGYVVTHDGQIGQQFPRDLVAVLVGWTAGRVLRALVHGGAF